MSKPFNSTQKLIHGLSQSNFPKSHMRTLPIFIFPPLPKLLFTQFVHPEKRHKSSDTFPLLNLSRFCFQIFQVCQASQANICPGPNYVLAQPMNYKFVFICCQMDINVNLHSAICNLHVSRK